ncbi:hypothetical protein P43SY_002291 [Pythium insidiosum]|uniref:Uncharacterized protein n=1 Tax=Pythium insidiosum TaxID=114742 RepID=A0AAD5QF49_PYTIN|nr:hypothetical protein P43SY_002291 [Pythium insidiosum]
MLRILETITDEELHFVSQGIVEALGPDTTVSKTTALAVLVAWTTYPRFIPFLLACTASHDGAGELWDALKHIVNDESMCDQCANMVLTLVANVLQYSQALYSEQAVTELLSSLIELSAFTHGVSVAPKIQLVYAILNLLEDSGCAIETEAKTYAAIVETSLQVNDDALFSLGDILDGPEQFDMQALLKEAQPASMLYVLPCFLVEASRRNDLDRGVAMLSCLGEILSTAAADLPAMYGSVLNLLFRHYGQCRRDPIIPCQMVVLHVIMCHRGNSADDHHLSSHRERTRLSLQVLQFLTHATGLLAGDDPERSTDDTAILKTVDFVKELVYALDARAEVLEAAVGVLAHLAKSDCLHRMLLRMRELPTAAVFIEDPYSLLSAFSPSTHTGVLHRQCRFLERLVACGESRLLVASKRGALLCFSKALGVPDDSIRASAANGLALVSTTIGSDRLPIEARQQLSQAIHFIFEHDDCRLLKECHAALHDCARALQDEASRRHIKLIVALAEVFENVTSSKGIAPMQAVIGSRLTELPKTLVKLLSLDAIHTDAFAPDKPWPRLHLVRVLRRLVKDAQVAAQFRDHNLAHMSEPFDLLIQQLHPLRVAAVTRNKAGDAYVLELLRVLIRLTEDPQVCDVITSRADALDILFFYFRSPTFSHSLHLVWVIVQNLATNAVHVIDLVERLTTPQRVLVLTNEVKWDDDTCALAATIVQAALALALGHAGVHSLLLKYIPAFSAMLLSEAVRHWDSGVLERLTLVLAHIIGACSRQLDVFTQVLALIERILYLCELYGEVAAPTEARHERGSLEWTNGMRTAVERLISALCDLLLLFHEDEARRTVFPGYALTLRLRPRVAPRAVAIARRRGTEKRRLGTTAWRLTLRCKRTGVFCEGFSPETDEMLDQVLRILTAACTFRVFREAKRSRSGTVVACGNCVVYVANFFFHLSQTVSGRFMFMNPRAIEFWKRLVPTMDKFSLLKLAQALDECVLSKDQVGSFLTSGALSLLVAATLKVVKDAAKSVQGDATGVSWQRVPPSQSAAVAFDAFLQFVIGAAVLTERSQFLQSTYFLVHTGAKNGISVAGVVVAAIVFSKGSAPYLPLACKVLSRFLCVFTLHEAAEFLRSCPVQIARGLGWLIDEKDVMEALLTTIKHTEPEALMKSRILVRVVHSTLLRTAILGLIDKGVPEVLHHNSLKLMAAHMERLLACSQTADVSSPILGSRAEDSTPPNARQPRGNAAVFKPVERLAAGIHAVGGAANLLFTNTIAGLDDDDEAQKGTADLAACVRALRAVVEETAVFTSDNYKKVFKRFEENNDDLELVAAMESCSQAILFVQGLFYASEIIREAVFSAIWDDYDRGADHPVVNPTSRALCDEASEAVGVFLMTVERILEWIAISLQNSEMDSLYFGHKLQNLLKLASELLLLPLEILDSDESTDRDAEMADVGSVSSQALVSRGPVRTHRLVDDYPVYLQFRCLELRSWLWSVLGFLPYLCVRHEDKFRIVQFRQTANDRAPHGSWYGGMFREYSCSFEAVNAGHDHVKTSYRELPHAVDVEIWMYLPFWYRDVLISQAKVPLLSIAIGLDEFDFQFYPLSSRGVRSYQPDVVATLKMTLSDREGAREDTAIEAIASEFPAYSTAGSRVLRRFLRKISSRVYSWVSSLGGQVASAVKMDRFLPSSPSNDRNMVGVLGVAQTATPASPSIRDSILECVRKIKQELEDAILPDKLLGSYEKHNAAEQCALLMTQLDEATPRFVDALTRSFETRNRQVWADTSTALDAIRRERVPEWHSFERMLAPTTLNHFLIQPMERLQFYCAVHQYLDSQLTSKDGANITAADPKFPNLDGDFNELEALRVRRLLKYHAMDPFDAAARLKRLYQDARSLPAALYREGITATVVHWSLWLLLSLTIWRISIAKDAVRDSIKSFALWIGLALFSIRRIASEIPTFREVRRVDSINLTTFPYCIRNYMAIGSVIWEGFQLNTTSFSVWKQSYKPKQLAALTTIDLQDLGLGFVQVNVFMAMQVASLLGLGAWFFCLKASNKFKSLQWLNYFLTFLLPNLLGGMLFMFLSKQFYLSAACYRNGDDVVLRANEAIHCWTPEHRRYALQGMFGMSIFVPVAVLAYGSYQVFFPEVNLDVQTSPVLNVNSQIVKAAMMGALTFFMNQVVRVVDTDHWFEHGRDVQ